jgi:glycosyltransferase involved in cell wall biosynthesis
MRIVDVSFIYDEFLETAEQQLGQHYTSVGWAEALSRQGAEVLVVKRFSKQSSFLKNNVYYHFIKDKFGGNIKAWQIPVKVLKTIASLDPDVVHLHNLSLSLQTLFLRSLLKKKTAVIIQHHGGPYHKGLKKTVQDVFNSVADGFFFTTVEQGDQWFSNKKNKRRIMPVMEGSTFFDYETRDIDKHFHYHNRGEARQRSGIKGNPVFLWVGRLDNNKDPLTVLSGFEMLCSQYPDAALYMIYSEEKLLEEAKKKIYDSEILNAKVQLLGKIQHKEIEAYYHSSDYFALGSHYEGSGYALSEALRCGCVPIITNIPSFRMMTNNGQLGALWQPGDKDSFVEAATIAMDKALKHEAEACIKFFQENLSFDAIANVAIDHYRKVIDRRLKK